MDTPEVNAFTSDYLNNILRSRGHPVDRLLHDELRLPFEFDQVKMKPNDDATAQTWNIAMNRLYDNYLYLVSNTKMSPPMDRDYHARLNNGAPVEPAAFANTSSASSPKMSQIDHMMVQSHDDGVWYSMTIQQPVSGGQSSLRMWSETTGVLEPSQYIDANKSNQFRNPISMCRDNADYIYILDAGHNTDDDEQPGPVLYRYDIYGLLRDDPLLNQPGRATMGRELNKYVGARVTDNVFAMEQFHNPKQVISDGDYVYVVDVSESVDHREVVVIKKFDTRLNWVSNIALLNIDTRDNTDINNQYLPQFKDMMFYNDRVLVLTGESLNEYDDQFNFIRTIDLTRSYNSQPDQTTGKTGMVNNSLKFIRQSEVNPNVLYLIRERMVEKVYYSRLEDRIRDYNVYRSPRPDTQWTNINELQVFTDPVIKNRGDVVVFNHPGSVTITGMPGDTILITPCMQLPSGRYQHKYHWVENEVELRKALTYQEFDDQMYTLEQVHVQPGEFTTNITYNKSIAKMLYNLMKMLECIKGTFAIRGEYVVESSTGAQTYFPPSFEGVHYSVDNQLFVDGYQVTLDNYVHLTEPFITGVFNRCLYELYNLQLQLLDIISITWVHEPNTFELGEILSLPCPGGIKSDADRPFITDSRLCIMPDDNNLKIDICSMYAINTKLDGGVLDHNGQCIIYASGNK